MRKIELNPNEPPGVVAIAPRRRLRGECYLLPYNFLACFIVGIWVSLSALKPGMLSRDVEETIVHITIIPWIVLILGNAVFIIAHCRALRREKKRIRWRDQVILVGSLVPLVGIWVYTRLERD
jgi:hypothetical protein